MSEPFVAEIKIFAGNFAPRGYAFCNGQLLPIAQNTALFSLIGTTYGGDGHTTTGLPNLQARAAMHAGSGPGLTPRKLGQIGGVNTVTLSTAQMPQHSHALSALGDVPDDDDPGNAVLAEPDDLPLFASNASTPVVSMAADALPNAGGSGAHNNLMPYTVLNFIIALVGLYPSPS
jgi:microcystin-dependent protein